MKSKCLYCNALIALIWELSTGSGPLYLSYGYFGTLYIFQKFEKNFATSDGNSAPFHVKTHSIVFVIYMNTNC